MADNTTRSDGIISLEYLHESLAGFLVVRCLVCIIWMLILILGPVYYCCKKDIKCCNIRHRGNRETDRLLEVESESTSSCRLTNWFCNSVELTTGWILVDLLRTPNVTKELEQDKKHKKVFLKVGNAHSFVLGRNIRDTSQIFVLVLSVPFLMASKILLGVYLQILDWKMSEQSGSDMNVGSEGRVKVVCYIPENSTHQINSTTWNMHCKMPKGHGDYFYSSGIFDDNIILASLADIAGLYGLYAVLCQIYLSIALNTGCKRYCYKRWCQTYSSICMFIVLYIILPATSMLFDIFLLHKPLIAALCSDQYFLLSIVAYSILLAQVMTSYSLESEQQRKIVVSEDTSAQKASICMELSVSNHEEDEPCSSSDDNPIQEDHYDLVTSM